jgi:predicted outer membrane repeat protein
MKKQLPNLRRHALRTAVAGAIAAACLGSGPLPLAAAAPGPVTQVTPQARFVRCGAGALADAIRAGGRLVLSRGCVYLLTQPLPVLHGKLHIEGNKATIRRSRTAGTPGFSLLQIAPNGVVTIRDATLRNGRSPHHGGAIDNAGGQLTVISVVFKHNTARQGGAIWNGGRALLRRATFLRNHAQAGGGLFSAGPAQLESAFFTANTAVGRGGAIRGAGHLTAKFVTFRRNHAAAGGAVFAGGLLTLDSSIFLSNRAAGSAGLAGDGGGLYAVSHLVRATGLTLRNNWSRGAGGAVYLAAAVRSALFQRAVIFGNRSGSGGGIENSGGSTATVHLASSTITQNTPSNCAPSGSVPGCSG